MSGAPSAKKEDGIQNYVINVSASITATALLFAGGWLAERFVPNDITLQYTFSEQRAGRLASWNIKLINATDVAFNVNVSTPHAKILAREFSTPSEATIGWAGQLMKGQRVEALLVLEEPSARLSSGVVEGMIAATYDERNSATGIMEPRTADVKEAGGIPIARSALYGFVFIFPLTTAVLLTLAYRAWNRRRERQPSPSPADTGQHSQ
ncbi:hypothetical protein JC796_06430 [Delftia acidovorans]|uniref:hypothetical protein n=1 Tax=Delftia acidovorans TaxID=80866 RepID=UPI0018E8D861|nr:hypothetical protein [Delftia acidovorans]MBJ2140359.1 hypothetical protein [Delftia acidovorans]